MATSIVFPPIVNITDLAQLELRDCIKAAFDAVNEVDTETLARDIVLQNTSDLIKAEALGSWSWDKVTGLVTMLDPGGNQVAIFEVTDTAISASRERRQDLEV